MPNTLTVEEIVPLVEALPPEERERRVRLITGSLGAGSFGAATREQRVLHG